MKQYLTVRQISELYPAFSESSLRWLIFNNIDDFNECTRRIGRKIVINCEEFEAWIDSQHKKK